MSDRRRQWRAAAVTGPTAVVLTGVTARGSADDDGGDRGAGRSPAPSGAASGPAAPAAGAGRTRLEAAASTDGRSAGTYTASQCAASQHTPDGPLDDVRTAGPAVCRAFVSAFGAEKPGAEDSGGVPQDVTAARWRGSRAARA